MKVTLLGGAYSKSNALRLRPGRRLRSRAVKTREVSDRPDFKWDKDSAPQESIFSFCLETASHLKLLCRDNLLTFWFDVDRNLAHY